MKNKKGFTLVELMAVIVVLAIIIAIAVPSYGKIKSNIDKKNYENKVKLIKVAAEKYKEDTQYETMFVETLIENGFIDPDNDKGEIINDITGKVMNCDIIKVNNEKGINYAELIEEKNNEHHTQDGKCDKNLLNKYSVFFTINMYELEGNKTGEQITKNKSNWWTNKDVRLTIKFNTANPNWTKIEWYKGMAEQPIKTVNKGTNVESNYDVIINGNMVITGELYTAKVTLEDGKEYYSKVYVYIDKIIPKFYQNDGNGLDDKWKKEIKYNIKAYDYESGLYGYKINKITDENNNSLDDCSTDKKEYKKNNSIKITENGTYNVCIIDNAGNISSEIKTISKIDKNNPKISTIIAENKGANYVDLTVTAQDMESGIDHFIIYYGTSSSTLTSKKELESNNKNPGEIVSMNTSITGLTPGLTYFFRSDAYDKTGNYLSSNIIQVQLCTWNTYYYYTTSTSTGTTSTLKNISYISVGETFVSTSEMHSPSIKTLYRTKYKTTAYWTYTSYTGTYTWYESARKDGGVNYRYTNNNGKSVWTTTLSGCYNSYGTGFSSGFVTSSTSIVIANKQTETYWIRTYKNGVYYTSWYTTQIFNGGHYGYQYEQKGSYDITGTRNASCGTTSTGTTTVTNTVTLYSLSTIYSGSSIYDYFPLYFTYTTYDKNTSLLRNPVYYTTISTCEV